MANKFAEDIRRIARGTRYRDPLGLYQPREPIGETTVSLVTNPLALGGGYGDGGLNNETPSSDGPNSDTEQNENEGEQNPAQDPNNPNSFYKGGAGDGPDSAAGEGSFDVEDVIDGTAGPQTSIDGTSGGINEFTGMTDCDTGTPFNFHPDGFFPAPEGWEDAETPPSNAPDGFEEGFFWYRIDPPSEAATDPVSVYRQIIESGSSTWVSGSVISYPSPTTARVQFTIITDQGSEVTSEDIAVKDSCAGYTDPSIVSICQTTTADFTEEFWPTDGTFELANQNGNLVTSDFDADAPAPYSSSAKDFCFGDGRTGKMLVTADGGTMMYETSGGAPTGTARVYKPDGTMRAAGDATETFTSQYLPK